MATNGKGSALSKRVAGLKRWAAEAKRTVMRAEAAKLLVRTAKAEWKKARKSAKVAKKAARVAKVRLKSLRGKMKPREVATAEAKSAGTVKAAAPRKKTQARKRMVQKSVTAVAPRTAAAARRRVKKPATPAVKSVPAVKPPQSAAGVTQTVVKRFAAKRRSRIEAPTAAPTKSAAINGAEPLDTTTSTN